MMMIDRLSGYSLFPPHFSLFLPGMRMQCLKDSNPLEAMRIKASCQK